MSSSSQTISQAEAPSRSSTALSSICLVTQELLGPARCGGIGTAYSCMARFLAEVGHEITVLYLPGVWPDRRSFTRWQRECSQAKIRLEPLPEAEIPLGGSAHLQVAYRVYQWLQKYPFEIVHFHEWLGAGYWALLAKHQGLAFQSTTFCVGLHGPTRWIKEANQQFLDSVDELERDAIEKRCVELADVVWSPSAYLLEWVKDHGWKLPREHFVQPYLVEALSTGESTSSARSVRELVVFGRLEVRKGVLLFCDALDQLAEVAGPDLAVTFLGEATWIDGVWAETLLHQRAARWPFRCKFLTHHDRSAALKYLAGPGRLAVVPSLLDNSPLAVLECLQLGRPFLASRVGGIPEVIAPEDRDATLFAPRAAALAERLRQAIQDGVRPARPAVDQVTNYNEWRDWHSNLWVPLLPPIEARAPLVSVCLVTHDRPVLLQQAVASLREQDYPNFEVVLVDDGSTMSEAKAILDDLEPEFQRRGWRIVTQDNRYLGAARNTAVRHAAGEYLLFMDDDNLAKPEELSTLVAVAERTGADVVATSMDFFSALDSQERPVLERRWLCAGVPALAVGLARNCFGDANALVRRSAFDVVGGFTEDQGITHEDWELLLKMVLHGLKLEIVPEALFWYRVAPDSMIRRTSPYHNYARHLRPCLEEVPEPYRDVIRLAQGLALRYGGAKPAPPHLVNQRPLRYRVADGFNRLVKPLGGIHALGRWLVQRLLGGGRP